MLAFTELDNEAASSQEISEKNIAYQKDLQALAHKATDGIIILTANPVSTLHSLLKKHTQFIEDELVSQRNSMNSKELVEHFLEHLSMSYNAVIKQYEGARDMEAYCKAHSLKHIKISKDDVTKQPEKTLETIFTHFDIDNAEITKELLPIEEPENTSTSFTLSKDDAYKKGSARRKSTSSRKSFSNPHYYMTYNDRWTGTQDRKSRTIRKAPEPRKKTSESLQTEIVTQMNELLVLTASGEEREALKKKLINTVKETYDKLAAKTL